LSELTHFGIETKDPERTMSLDATLFDWTYEEATEGDWIKTFMRSSYKRPVSRA